MLRSRAAPVLAVVAGLALAAWELRAAFPPYLWIAATWVVVAAVAFATSGGRARVAWFNFGAIVLALGLGEFVAWRATPAGTLRTESDPVFVTSHDYLGNAATPGVTAHVTRWDGDSLLFRVTYTIDARGWRSTPFTGDSAAPVVAFFGCSLTFGEGVADSATLPAQLSLASGGRYRGLNLGFSGWGPHQMLAILEHRLEAPAMTGRPVLGVYQAIPSHIYRVLGRTSWDPGPRYRLGPDGAAHFAGRFMSARASLALNLLYRSFLVRKLVDGWNQRLGDEDYRLFFAVVDAARKEFVARYPGADFLVLYWDARTPSREFLELDRRMLAGFAVRGIRVVTASQALPGYPAEAERYLLSHHDAHPNALADRALARYLVDHALPPALASPGSAPAATMHP